jgi:hypothetical protein
LDFLAGYFGAEARGSCLMGVDELASVDVMGRIENSHFEIQPTKDYKDRLSERSG